MSRVIDASVVLKVLVEEEGSEAARRLVEETAVLRAPALVLVEVHAALTKKLWRGKLAAAAAQSFGRGLRALVASGLLLLSADEPLLAPAFDLSLRLDHAFHACLYLALARTHIPLVTADLAFVDKVRGADVGKYVAQL